MKLACGFFLSLLPIIQGCSSTYEPARSPHISTVVEGAQPVFVKDGQHIGGTAFGLGLVDAVRENPRAQAEARTGRNLAIGGIVLDVLGLVATTTSVVLIDGQALSQQPGGDRAAPAALLLGGLVGVTAGTIMLLSAPAHIYDAVNIYNDGLDGRR